MGDLMVQGIAAGLSGASAWDLDDAMHVGGAVRQPQNLKQWGFWNSLGGQDGYPASDRQLRPWYYPWSVSRAASRRAAGRFWSRALGPRAARRRGEDPDAGKYDLSFAVVNDSDSWRARLGWPCPRPPRR